MVQQNDYLYELGIIDREGRTAIFSKQVSRTDGGHLVGIQGKSNRWILSSNIEIPIIKKCKAFADFSILNNNNENSTYIDAGIMLSIIPKRFEIFFPLFLKDLEIYTDYQSIIRFKLNMNIHDIVSDLKSQI